MPLIEPATHGPAQSAPPSTGYAFGVLLDGAFPVPHVAPPGASPIGRRVTIEPSSADALERRWRTDGVESVVERRYPDGRPFMLIHRHEQLGYRIWAPRYGRYEVAGDGRRITCAIPARTSRWQRLFFAQPLPLAAALQGVELFHASAVALDGHAIAFVAPSGTGKTSIAAHLVSRGAGLVTDDVLALEATADGILAHPGMGILCVDEDELERTRGPVGSVVGRSDKLHVSAPLTREPIPLKAVFYLERSTSPGEIEIRPTTTAEPQLLLGSSFIAYLRAPQYLLDHLEFCAHAARTVPTFRLVIPPGVGAADVATLLEGQFA